METHDLLQPPSQSKLMGEENIILHTDPLLILEAKNKFQFRRCLRYIRFDPVFVGDGTYDGLEYAPVGVLQLRTEGDGNREAIITQLYVRENHRRFGIALWLLMRARQDFKVFHDFDENLTDLGRAFVYSDSVRKADEEMWCVGTN